MAPTFERRKHHEKIGCAVPFIFVIIAGLQAGLHCDRYPGLRDQLLGGLIQANQGAIGIARPLIDFQNILHRGYEASVGIWRDDPLFLEMRFEKVFFRVLATVLGLVLSTIFNWTA